MDIAPRVPIADSRGVPSHRRVAAMRPQALWLGFGGGDDRPWLRWLRPGYRHCFAALRDAEGWTVLDPLSGRLLVTRLDVPPGYDLPRFWQRAGCRVLGPFTPAPAAPRVPAVLALTCVAVCRALLGPGAPFALTPHGLYRRLKEKRAIQENILDRAMRPV